MNGKRNKKGKDPSLLGWQRRKFTVDEREKIARGRDFWESPERRGGEGQATPRGQEGKD